MFLQSLIQMGGFTLNHHWHGINVLSLLECALIAALICSVLPLAFKFVRRSKRLTSWALVGSMMFATAAYAANTALSALTAAGSVTGTNIIYVVQTTGVGGVKATMTQVATFLFSLVSGDVTCTSGGSCTVGKIGGVTPPSPIGSVTSIGTSCGVAGGTITTTGTITAQSVPEPQTGANYPFASTDCGKIVYLNNASAQTPTIPSGATLGNGWATEACNIGAGTQTITPASGTIGGSSSYPLAGGTAAAPKCVGLASDGTNLNLDLTGVGGGASPGGSSGQLQTNNGSGGFGAVAAPSGTVVGTTDTQTLTNKSIAASEINSGTLGASQMPALTGDCISSSGTVAVTCPALLPQYPYLGASSMYFSMPGMTGITNTVFTVNRLVMIPVYLPAAYSLTAIAVNVTTGQTGGSGYLGLYSSCFSLSISGCTSLNSPNQLLASGGATALAMATSTQTVTQSISYTTTYTGLYFVAIVATASSTMPTLTTANAVALMNGVNISGGSVLTAPCLYRVFTFPTGVGLNASESANAFTIGGGGTNCPVLGVR